MKIKAVMCPADREPYITWISDTLENMQKIVGGFIEACATAESAVVICNEEECLMGLPENKSLPFGGFCGDCFICGAEGENFTSLSEYDMAVLLMHAKRRWKKHEG